MNMSLSSSPFSGLTSADTLALIGKKDGFVNDPVLQELDREHKGAITKTLEDENFKAKWKKTNVQRPAMPGPGRLIFVGLEEAKLPFRLLIKQAAGLAVEQAKNLGAKRLVLAFAGTVPGDLSRRTVTRLLAEGALLSNHERFSHKKCEKETSATDIETVVVCWPGQDTLVLENAIMRAQIIARGVNTARDLVNEPAGSLTPEAFAERVVSLAGPGVTVKSYGPNWLKEKGMGGILGVSAGSNREPRLVEVEYHPQSANSEEVVLVGKGITFDSGGLNLKPGESMKTMKSDMAGAAALTGLVAILSELAPSRAIRILLPLAENMTGGSATKLGDVLKMYGGKTVEVMNTDAEGRLILADALAYGAEKSPSLLMDIATLTGASVVALGTLCATVMGRGTELVKDVLSSAEASGELFWELPLIEFYKKQLETKTADLKNVGQKWGGAITAGLFLSEFVGDIPWAHLDIAGPAWADKQEPAFPEGGTGFGVATIIELLSPIEE